MFDYSKVELHHTKPSKMLHKVILTTKSIFEFLVRLAGPLFVIMATTMISAVIIVHFRVIIPFYSPDYTVSWFIHVMWSTFLSFNIGFNYFMCIFTRPGIATNLPDDAEFEKSTELPAARGEENARYCKICKRTKPTRAHHCHVCNRCVLRMDHHCPWVSNCVGFYNHRYFVLFLLYLWLGCAYVAVMSFVPFRMTTNYRVPWRGTAPRGTVIFAFIITVAVVLALLFMLSWHLYLVYSNQTTIEFYSNRYRQETKGQSWRNEFDLGSRKNFEMFFGTKNRYWFWWVLPSLKPPPGDGIHYPTNVRSDFV